MKKIKTKKEQETMNKKKGITLISIIILIATTIHVNAGIQDANLTRSIIENTYAITTLEDGKHLYNLEYYEFNGKTAYCIEIGNKITTDTYNSTTDLTQSGLSTEQIDAINKIMYYGYDYPGHNDYKYYMATQELIWETIDNIDVYWTNEMDKNGQAIDIESYKNKIKELIEKHKILPSISNKTYKLFAGSRLQVLDENNVIEEYEIISKGNQKYKIESSRLIVDTNGNELQTDEVVLRRKNIYNEKSTLYYNSSSQKLMTGGTINLPTTKVKVITVGGDLHFSLVDYDTKESKSQGQASLTGAVYEIYNENNELIDSFTTTENKTNLITNLVPQTYYIKQTKASPGYILEEEKIKIVVNTLTKNITLEEEIIKSKIEILKIYGDENIKEFQSEKDIIFDIYDNNFNLYQSIITNELGYAEITLPYGIYAIKQNNSTLGYGKVEDIYLNINESSNETIRYNLFDNLIKVKINIITKDNESKNNILESKVKYKIKDKNTDEYVSYNDNEIFETNEIGEVLIPQKLPYGIYQVEQITTPSNYIENQNIIEFTIDDKSNIITNEEGELVLNIDFYNKQIKGKIYIETFEEIPIIEENNYHYNIIPKENVELTIIADADIITPDGITKYNKGDIVEIITTNEQGQAETSILYLGKYCIKEKNQNECISLEKTNDIKEIIEKNITLTNKVNKYNVTLTNIEEETKNLIKGTIIELYDDNNILINTSITNNEGIIKISNLSKGKYYLKQKNVNSNYILNEEKICFEIEDKNIEITMINKKLQNKKILNLEIPNTLSNNNHLKEIFSISLIIIGIVIYAYKKKNSRNNNN